MKKYEITLYYHTNVMVVVEAENEHEAVMNAVLEASYTKYDGILLANMQEDGTPDIKEIEEEK